MSLFASRLLLKEGLSDKLVIVTKGFTVSMAINVLLAGALVFQLSTADVKNNYFTVDPHGRITEVFPLI